MLLVHWYGSLLLAHHHASATRLAHVLYSGGTTDRLFLMYLVVH